MVGTGVDVANSSEEGNANAGWSVAVGIIICTAGGRNVGVCVGGGSVTTATGSLVTVGVEDSSMAGWQAAAISRKIKDR